ncbi:hypothetical protein [Streptomyces sp. NPDC046821]|uniref:hypothetical protein n=1 Tax=Streptomyces sp. NPDC046821 TaxID=3154702 RepID=UPI0033F9FAFC
MLLKLLLGLLVLLELRVLLELLLGLLALLLERLERLGLLVLLGGRSRVGGTGPGRLRLARRFEVACAGTVGQQVDRHALTGERRLVARTAEPAVIAVAVVHAPALQARPE